MKFTVQIKDITDALKKCQLAQTSRGTLPILSCLKIEATDDSLTITGTDLDRWMTCTVPAKVAKNGSVAISSRIISAIMSGSGEATFETDAKHKAKIQVGSSKFNISGLAASEFPEMKTSSGSRVFRVKSSELIRATSAVKWAASTEINRYVLNGVYAEFILSELTFVATNGTCLSKTIVDFEGEPSPSFIIPSASVPLIEAIASEDDPMEFSAGDSTFSVRCGNAVVVSKIVEGLYPSYRKVCPDASEFKTRSMVNCSEFIDAMDRVSVVIKDRSSGSEFDISDGKIVISAKAEDSAEAEVSADVSGPALKIRWRAALLRMPMRSWNCESVEIATIDEMSPGCVSFGRNQFIIMPMRTV